MSLNCFQSKNIQRLTISMKNIDHYSKINKIIKGVYLSTLKMSLDKEQLQEIGITHILCGIKHNRPQFKEVSFFFF